MHFFFDNLYTQYPSHLIGGGLGVLMGLFFGALDNPIMAEEMTARQQIVYTAKQMGRRSISNAKTFAVMGLIFSAAECVVEKVDIFCGHGSWLVLLLPFALLFYTLYICPHFLNPNYRSTPILRREANGGGMGEKTYTLGMDDPLCIHRELTEHSALDFSKAPHDISNQITTNTTHQFYRCKSAPLPFHRLKCRFDM